MQFIIKTELLRSLPLLSNIDVVLLWRHVINSESAIKLLSVVVCTHNRYRLLRKCLLSLANQTAKSSFFEIIVVNNNSTDETQKIAECFTDCYDNFRLIDEEKQGLSHARNRGLREAGGDFVAYIDDDAIASPDWIEKIIDFVRLNETVIVFGGPYYGFSELPLPGWFPPEYGSFDLGDKEISIDAINYFLCGTNIIFKKDVIKTLGGFRSDLGMNGTEISYGEETRLQIDLKQQGYDIFYVPSIKVKHLIAEQKLSLRWLLKSAYAVGYYSSTTFKTQRGFFSCFAGICYGFVHALKVFFTTWRMPFRRRVYYSLIPLASEIGALHKYIGGNDTMDSNV